MPERIQRKRARGWRMPEGAVYVGRPTKYGNPLIVGLIYGATWGEPEPITDSNIIQVFERYCKEELAINKRWLEPLRGKDLACWCPLSSPCHADVLLRLANSLEETPEGPRTLTEILQPGGTSLTAPRP